MPPNYMDLKIEQAEPLEFHKAALGRLGAFVVHRRSYQAISHTGESRAAVALSFSCPIRFENVSPVSPAESRHNSRREP